MVRGPGLAQGPRRLASKVPLSVWLFIAIPLAVEVFWVFWPAANSFQISTTQWNGVGPAKPVGLGNYIQLFRDPVFETAIVNNVIWLVGFGGLSIILGLIMALLLAKARPGVSLYRAAIYMPMVFSLTVTGLFWRALYAPDGPVNGFLGLVGLKAFQEQWLANPHIALYAVLVAAIWREVGYVMVLYLAGLNGIDPALSDAAQVDGATKWQNFRFVTFPQLRSVNAVIFSIIVIDSLRTFDIVWAMTQGGPYNSTQLLSTYMYQQGFTLVNLGYGSAIAVVIFLLAIIFIIIYLARSFREQT